MLTKKLLPAAVTSALLLGAGLAQAQSAEGEDKGMEESSAHSISANITLASDYTFRGISQTDEKPAIQGGLDYAHETGIYIGTWWSNVNFDEASNDNDYHPYGGSNASTEADYYVGFAGETDGGFGYDISYIYFDYKGDSNFDYQEFALAFSYVGFTLGVNYSDEYLGNGGPEFWYPYIEYSHSLFWDLSLDLHYGYNDASDADYDFFGSDDTYSDWSVTVGLSALGLDWAVAYVDTDLDDLDAADARAVFSVSKSF